ncbi:MAG: hypothetical protein KDA42_08380 [Planctomycetales bacterium]|nr:hypothetical protein [Planctomycetales bacterium]
MPTRKQLGGVIHTYQKYDPRRFPSPTQPAPDLVSPAFEHMLTFGSMRELTEEELARAVRIDPSQLSSLGPSLDALRAILEERKRKILATYETDTVTNLARRAFREAADRVKPPKSLREPFRRFVKREQLYELEQLWYLAGDDQSPFARAMVKLVAHLGEKYEVDELAAKYEFTGRTPMDIPLAIEVKEELERIDELLRQLEEARESGQIGVIDMDALSEFAEPGDVAQLDAIQQQIQDILREMAERQGLELSGGMFRLSPQAYKLFQGKLLERIFSQLEASRSGRHQGPVVGEGAVEIERTKPYEFGDSVTNMDIPATMTNAMIRQGPGLPIRIRQDDIQIHRTRNTPKCATTVVMDMSGSMRYDGQYVNVKRMALALQGLIQREYPGDFLRFVQMYSFARLVPPNEIVHLMPKPVTVYDPVVRLKADMSDPAISESLVPPHFTNIQHGLAISRRLLATQDTPNRQIVLITDGLPTAHFEEEHLYLLYPPDPQTESATMREGRHCAREGITINIFLLPSWSQSREDIRFAHRLAESTSGRVLFTAGGDLDRYVVWDYLERRRDILA